MAMSYDAGPYSFTKQAVILLCAPLVTYNLPRQIYLNDYL